MAKAVPLYEAKEPLMPAESGGIGYQGVLLLDPETDEIQCHICGEWYAFLGKHIGVHDVTARDYKLRFGLRLKTALINEKGRDRLIKMMKARKHKNITKENARAIGSARGKKGGVTRVPLEERNRRNLCPEQLLTRLKKLGKKKGRAPTWDELYADNLHPNTLKFAFGSLDNAFRLANLERTAHLSKFQRDSGLVLELMRDFKKRHKREPSESDFRRSLLLPNIKSVYRYFGTLNNARTVLRWKIRKPGGYKGMPMRRRAA